MTKLFTDYLFNNLPQIYKQGGKQGYVYRLLSIFGDILDEVESEIAQLPHQLNPLRTRSELLPWLASWVALELDISWPEFKQRELINKMVDLYKWRGTIYGIQLFVEIYTGLKPIIIEPFQAGWRIGIQSTIGVDTKLYEARATPHSFSVIINSHDELSDEQKQKVRAIVEVQKPAHTKVIYYSWHFSY